MVNLDQVCWDKITHAYLFTGPGVGQNEEPPSWPSPKLSENSGARGSCSRRILAHNYPDVRQVLPEGNNIRSIRSGPS